MKGEIIDATVTVKQEIRGVLLKQRSEEISELIIQQAEKEEEKKAIAKDFKKQIDELKTDIDRRSRDLQQGYELIDRPCKKRKNYTDSCWEYYDDITEEIIKTEPFSEEDYQSSIEDYG